MDVLLVLGWVLFALAIGWKSRAERLGPTRTGLDVLEPTKGRRR